MSKYEKPYPLTRPFLELGAPGVLLVRQCTTRGYIECYSGGIFDMSYPSSVYRRARVQGLGGATCPALMSGNAPVLFVEYDQDKKL